jgi:ADP-heptose:LPS heptosyltransferase
LKLQAKPDAALLTHWQIQAQGFAVVHPGMFGSALNWPSEHYQNLLQELTAKIPVVITGTADDERFLTSLRECSTHPQIRWAVGKLTLTELLSILGSAQFVIAPSTGVLHLAASLGTACVGIYSPVRVHHPRRWGPRGPNARFVLPDVECPATLQCLGPVCVHYNCMTKISVTQVLKGLL